MSDETTKSGETSRKRPRDPPFVEDYRPYTGRQLAHVLERKATHKENWDLYYRNNTVNGYRDRHYIIREFHELREKLEQLKKDKAPVEVSATTETKKGTMKPTLSDDDVVLWMEAGCGVGNAILPILEEYGNIPGWGIVGFDISSVAIALLQEKQKALPFHMQQKLVVRVLNPVEENITISDSSSTCTSTFIEKPVDFVSMIFVLCSIPVEKHKLVLQRITSCLKDNGIFFFRDYCVDDHAEKRFATCRQVEENTFARSNGTLSHFFSLVEVRELFQANGFEVIELSVVEREVQNRREGMRLHRRFLQGRFRKMEKKG
ncbi:methyltransferase like 6 [Trypanosoma theileri]|uniref:tRNA N(3)-methylcytidine methyltransferase n=1 Tax=Trypanosoma theileri TaxID=67003 RepID=A0A1X0P5J2_9TRYP|nr:methyltransferase like 6 [Trypanosoma theileri]ORC92101.1 methyltransferase like 6 [Trypanosoma theileri]